MDSQYREYRFKESIEEETALLHAFFNSVDQYQVLLNKQLEIVAFNDYAFNFSHTYLKLELKKGKSLTDFIDPSFTAYFKALCNKAFSGNVVHFEHFINGQNDKRVWLDFTIYPLSNTQKKATGLMLVGNNINNQKKKEKIIRNQTESLSVIAQLQSHQVRNPVSSILGILSLIKEENFELKKEYILGLETATKQLDQVIRAIVTQSRKE
ncbi:MAG: sensor histidine kinase [Segetibacter sp.]|nr:sensor histidine kinase [Segetibacter sp.]